MSHYISRRKRRERHAELVKAAKVNLLFPAPSAEVRRAEVPLSQFQITYELPGERVHPARETEELRRRDAVFDWALELLKDGTIQFRQDREWMVARVVVGGIPQAPI